MMCCKTLREASRLRSSGSASLLRWQPSPPEYVAQLNNVVVLGLGLRSPIQHHCSDQHCYGAGHIHVFWLCWGPCSLLCELTNKHSIRAVQSAPITLTHRDFFCVFVTLGAQKSRRSISCPPLFLKDFLFILSWFLLV